MNCWHLLRRVQSSIYIYIYIYSEFGYWEKLVSSTEEQFGAEDHFTIFSKMFLPNNSCGYNPIGHIDPRAVAEQMGAAISSWKIRINSFIS